MARKLFPSFRYVESEIVKLVEKGRESALMLVYSYRHTLINVSPSYIIRSL
jgi:hypothetical protein